MCPDTSPKLQDLPNDYGNKLFFELEAVADDLCNGNRSKFVALLKSIVKKSSLRYHKAKPAEPDADV